MLVRPARLNGRQAMVAEQVRVGDQTITIRDAAGQRPDLETRPSAAS